MKKLLILSTTFMFLGFITPFITEAAHREYAFGGSYNYGGGYYNTYRYSPPKYFGYQKYYYPNYSGYYNYYGGDYAFSGGYQNFWWH